MFCHWTSEKLSMLTISGLWNYNTTKYKGLQLIMALSEWFWDTTCIFHFPAISEVMLTPYDFSVITGLKLGGERVEGHDTISSTKADDYLGVNPPRVSGNNVSLMWLYFNIEKSKSVDTGTQIFMLFFIWSLCVLTWGVQ